MKFAKHLRITLLFVALCLGTRAQVNRIGSGTDLYFAGTSSNEHIDLDTIARTFATSDFTVEFWEKLDTSTGASSDIPFICNKDWASGANKGFVISKMSTATPSVWVNFTSASGSRFDLKNVPCPTLMTAWTHIAVSFNRTGSSPKIIVYINGMPADSGNLNTSTHSPTTSIVGTQHTRLAQDGTGAYSWGFKYKGYMDEVRIWKAVRTADQIRTNMCRKLNGSETNLVAYYNFNDGSGTTLRNLVSGGENGALKNMSGTTQWQTSGAAIGDSSMFIYPSSFVGASLQMNSTNHGNLKVNNVTGPVGGVQIYRVDTVPNTYAGINNNGSNNAYYGVFVAKKPATALAATPVSYDITHDYSNFTNAVTNHNNIKLFNRYGNDYSLWADIAALNNTSTNQFTDSGIASRREFIIGDFAAVSCANPINPYMDSTSATFARIKWTGTGSNWQVQYGTQGFYPGTGTITNVTTTVSSISGLSNGAFYDVYVRKICGAGDTSEWVGPLTIQPGYHCPMVSGVTVTQLGGDSVRISWVGTGSSVYNMEWGNAGFTAGTGVPVNNIRTNSWVLHGLPVGTSLDVYVKDSCIGLSSSEWFGPLTFTNTGHSSVAVGTIAYQNSQLAVYPNPANNTIYVDVHVADEVSITLFNAQGSVVSQSTAVGSNHSIDVSTLPAGIYLMQCRSQSMSETIKINIVK